ncbi:rod shape-determining protein MreC [Altererythrobacter sp. ZODW24]|uniref:rod shape-determining protein MreC n=1 Tax=Altererythrobacter sp. ZODW24 TaxID=2185142 RepID=UPI001F079CBD|nr:rod shape-determining protein MreC [Altererythrobacter sp. ZODW24]
MRRSGFSRRAQYSAFTGYVVAAIGALIGAVLLALSLWRPASFNGARSAAQDVVLPAGEAGAEVRDTGTNIFETISAYYRAGSRNAELRREVDLARVRLAEADAIEQENIRLKGLLDLRESDVVPITTARLVGSTGTSTRRFAYLAAGRDKNVVPGMPVRSPRGVLGRVVEAGSNISRVLLLTDSESVLPVRRATDEVVAFAEGRGDGTLRIRLINLGINPLKVGDVFVTSGAGGLYQPNTAVAVATKITPDGADARVIADPAGTNFVSVLPIWEPEILERQTLSIEEQLGE